MSNFDVSQIHHIARLAVLAMCARGVASSEFENPEVKTVQITIFRPSAELSGSLSELPVELEIFGASDVPMGGLGL